MASKGEGGPSSQKRRKGTGTGSSSSIPNNASAVAAAKAKEKDVNNTEAQLSDFIKNCSLKNITIRGTDSNDEEKTLIFSNCNSMADLFDPITDDGELKKRVISEGTGESPPVRSRVWIRFTSYLEDCNEPFETQSNAEDDLYTFRLFHTRVYPVLEFGAASMTLNERSHFLTTAKYAYGSFGIPQDVPEECAMIFMIELYDFKKIAILPIYEQPAPWEWAHREFLELKKAVETIKAKANERFNNGHYQRALSGYNRVMYILQRPKLPAEPEFVTAERNSLLFAVYNNMAMCQIQSHNYDNARSYCQKALALPPGTNGNRCKLYYRLAKAEYELGHFEESRKYCDMTLKLEPANKECRNLYDTVLERLNADSKVSNDLYKKMAAKLRISDNGKNKEHGETNSPPSRNTSESQNEEEEEEDDDSNGEGIQEIEVEADDFYYENDQFVDVEDYEGEEEEEEDEAQAQAHY